MTRRLLDVVRGRSPDIVHAHRTKEGIVGSLAAALRGGIPSLRTVHGAAEHAPAGVRRRVVAAAETWFARHLQRCVVAVSAALAEQLRRSMPGVNVQCIVNGIDEQVVREQAGEPVVSAGPRDPWRLCFAGRLTPVKRVDLFLRMAADLQTRRPGGYRFHVIGDGPLRAELESQRDALALRDFVTFEGFHANCLPIVSGMDAMLLTSDHEGLPMIALESLSLGVPVVSHAVGGLPDLLGDPRSGRLVRSRAPGAFADAVENLRAAREAGGAPRGSLLPPRYTAERCGDEYTALYRSLLAPSH